MKWVFYRPRQRKYFIWLQSRKARTLRDEYLTVSEHREEKTNLHRYQLCPTSLANCDEEKQKGGGILCRVTLGSRSADYPVRGKPSDWRHKIIP